MSSDDCKEYRVALVFNGGVSLAVWMSGVVQEIDLIRRASCGEEPPASYSASDRRHYETWRGKLEGRARVVIDIIAGTSAGGLNGALLAMALACDTDLPDLKEMWNEKAALTSDALLGHTDGGVRGSVLSGQHLENTLSEMLDWIRDRRVVKAALRPVTLFVTATALGRSDLRYRDMAGEPFLVADHRRLYRFSTTHLPKFDRDTRTFAPDPGNDFVENTGALVTAGRASASYPVAFAPVEETSALRDRRYPPDPDDLSAPDAQAAPRYLMDGGILDNAPIEPVIDEIGRRVPAGGVERVLAYVVPSNGVVASPAEETGSQPPKWVKVVGSALDFPRESDFRHDITAVLEALGADRSRGQTSVALLGRAVGSADVRAELAAGAEALLVSYRAGRIEGSLRQVRDRLAAQAANGPELEPTRSGSGMAYRTVWAGWVPAPDTPAATAVQGPSWSFGFSGARRTVRLLLKAVRMDMDGGRGDLRTLAEELSEIDAEITALEKVVAQTVAAAADEADDDPTLIGHIDAAFAEVGAAELLTERMTCSIARYAEHYVLPADLDVDGLRAVLAEIEIVTGAAAGNTEEQDPPSLLFVRLGPDVESRLYPGENRGGNKLYGASLKHFGAFGDPRWRDCDYTWGRLDAAAHVAKLVAKAKVTEMDDATTLQLEQEIVAAEGWPSPAAFHQMTAGAGQDDLPTLGLLLRTKAGRGVLWGVVRSGLGLLAHQGLAMVTGRDTRLLGRARPPVSTPPTSVSATATR